MDPFAWPLLSAVAVTAATTAPVSCTSSESRGTGRFLEELWPHFANISINGSFHMLEPNHLCLQNVSSVYIKTVVPCNSLGSQRLLFSPFILPPHTWATRSSLACNRSRRTYPMALLRNTFNFAWTSKGNSPSSRTHSWFIQLSFLTPKQSHDSLHGAECCTAQYFWQPHQVLLSVIFKSPWCLNKCSSHTAHLFPTEPSTHESKSFHVLAVAWGWTDSDIDRSGSP